LREETANAFGQTINGLKGKVTIVLIAHRLPEALKGIKNIHLAESHSAALPAPGQWNCYSRTG
jgi:hypothetical protein